MHLREAKEEELDEIYMMGYDVWGDSISESTYLKECRTSIKYARGKWYVLENEEKILLSSLLIYNLTNLNFDTELEIRGIGSISTPVDLRRQGYASFLVEKTINHINKNTSIDMWFLYSDIGVNFYNKLKFEELPNKFQNYPSTTLMVCSKPKAWNMDTNIPYILIPDYSSKFNRFFIDFISLSQCISSLNSFQALFPNFVNSRTDFTRILPFIF